MLDDLASVLVSGITTGAIYASIAFALTLTYSVSGIINLAQGEFYMLAPFIALLFMDELGWGFIAAAVASLAAVTVIAGVLYTITIAPLRHANEDNIILLTFGLIFVLSGLALVLFGGASRSFPAFTGLETVNVVGVAIDEQGLWIVGVTAVVLVSLWLFLTRTVPGVAMRAAADNPLAARIIGLRPRQIAVVAFCLSGFLGALTGLLAAPIAFVDYAVGLAVLSKGAIAAIVGGWGSYSGALAGALIFGLAEAASAMYLPTVYGTAFTVALMIGLLLIFPRGLVRGRLYRIREV